VRDAITGELMQELGARLVVDEPIRVERLDVPIGHVLAPAEDQPQMRIRGERGRSVQLNEADVDALAESFEQPREGGVGQAATSGRAEWHRETSEILASRTG
jgi:hypothetical protein